MPSFAGMAAPVALILPLLGAGSAVGETLGIGNADMRGHSGPAIDVPAQHSPDTIDGQDDIQTGQAVPLDALLADLRVRQIRIEQRVIVRIGPQRSGNRQSLLAQLPQRSLNTRYEERETGECLAVSDIAGVQTGSGNRLLLFLRDKQIMSLNLEKACRARDFYSGFYVERNEDGKICINRDELQSRNGVRCEIDRMMELVAVED